ncbi:MAG: superfamily II DNA or RNA helicase [Akkermansiaceae bacterium]|jgi:superfamily II DNA or RNA helicase
MQHHSSRRSDFLGRSFLAERLRGARSYDRIAGYFSSSILEVAGEELESISGKIRIICNSELQAADVACARSAMLKMRQEWCRSKPEEKANLAGNRFARLAEFLTSGKLEVRVMPDSAFGLIHGKAGVIELADGSTTAFLGSANESRNAWKMNYELIWENNSPETIAWVREEFDELWNHPEAFALADAVLQDIKRVAKRQVYGSISEWKKDENAASALVETPVYRRQYGLWAHQKYFVDKAFKAHLTPDGARFILADMVGLGKTIQLAMSAMLMALHGDRPVLIIVPKPLVWQWQDEMDKLLDMPSAVWDGKQWIDEHGISHGHSGNDVILKCPRKVAIVSQGLFSANTESARLLERQKYECVVLDEAHRARRRMKPGAPMDGNPEHNNLLRHMHTLARQTKSLLLATATPVQIHPIEGWDLLALLAEKREHVFGNDFSEWRHPETSLPVVSGETSLAALPLTDFWGWLRNPLPPSDEDREFLKLRRSLDIAEDQAVVPGDALENLSNADRRRITNLQETFGQSHSPFIRHIIRRTRDFLENEIDPETQKPYLDPVYVKLLGEGDEGAVILPPYLEQAYELAEEFCRVVARRAASAGFLKTLLLRRAGSSVVAGISTAKGMLKNWEEIEDEEESELEGMPHSQEFKTLNPEEKALLESYLSALESNNSEDPKFAVVSRLLTKGDPQAGNQPWSNLGCMIFSQYYDSAAWLAEKLSRETFPNQRIGLYAGSNRSAYYQGGTRQPADRDDLKQLVSTGELKILIGTDAASEGLNLQTLGTLINLDLPWNPTRLEQRKGRIQRIGQRLETVFVYNMRYRGSIEDRVHELLSSRLENIHAVFGQIPDTLEAAWIETAVGDIEHARQEINAIPEKHPFEAKYNQISAVDFESCSKVLNRHAAREELEKSWR